MMLKIKYFYIISMMTATTLHASQDPQQDQSFLSRLYTQGQNFIARTPLMPGWRSTEQQKEVARETLKQLLVDRDVLETELINNAQLSDEEKANVERTITDLNKEIGTQKIILGQKWSATRKAIAGTAGLGTAIGLGSFAWNKHKTSNLTPKQLEQLQDQHNTMIQKKLENWADN